MTAAKTRYVGSVWEVTSSDERVTVVRPDGRESVVAVVDGKALVSLDIAGEYTAGGSSVTAK